MKSLIELVEKTSQFFERLRKKFENLKVNKTLI